MKVVILCGGQGARLREETEFRPKPMVKIGTKPVLWHIMKLYSHYGFKEFVLCLGYKGDVIKEYFYHYELHASDFTVRLDGSKQVHVHSEPEEKDWVVSLIDTGETALKGARVKKVEPLIDGDHFMLTYGDGVSNIDLRKLLEFHQAHGKIGTVSGVRPPSLFGELKVAGDQVALFTEKPQTSTGLISGGFMVFSRRIFDYLSTDDQCDLEKGPMEQIAREGELMVYQHPGDWACVDTFRDLQHLNQLWELAACVLEGVGGPVSDRQPLVTVCVSAYNVERFLAEALRSILAQTYRNLEVIVLDNGSADKTFEVAQSFTDPRLRSLRVEKNMGAYEAMNYVTTMATGEFLAVFHSDDVYEPTIVERELAHLLAHPDVGAAFCMLNFIDEEGRRFGGADLPPSLAGRESLTYRDVMTALVRRKCTFLVCPTFIVRREVFDAVGPFQPERWGIATDVEMWLRVVRSYPIAILDERLFNYRRGPHQWSSRYLAGRTEREAFFAVMDIYLAMDGWREKLTSGDLVEYEFHLADDATFRAVNHVRNGDPGAALRLLRDHPYPWRTLLASGRRRKIRNLVLRGMIRAGVALRATRPLSEVLAHIGP